MARFKPEIDRPLLEYHIKAQGLSTEEFSSAMGFSQGTYYNKMTGKVEFTRAEIIKACEILSIEDPTAIFFARSVACEQQ